MGSSARQRLMVWTLALLATVAYGALYYAQPLLAVATEQAYGWSRTQTSLAFTLALLATAFLAPRVGRVLDQGHGRTWLALGALLGGLAFGLLAWTSNYVLFVAAWLLAGAAMSLTFYEAVFTVLGQQVGGSARRSATLTVTLIAGLASTVFVPLTTALLGQGGLQTALWCLASLLMGVGVLVWWIIPASGLVQAHRAVVPFTPDLTFSRLVWAFTLSRMVTVGIGLQLAPLLLASGYPPGMAAALTGLMGVAALPGRVIFAPLLQYWGVQTLTAILLGLVGVGALLLHFRASLPLTALGIVLFGVANGALTLARSELLVTWYPPAQFGTVNGRLAWPVNLAQALTPFGMGLLFVGTGGYGWSLTILTGLAAWSVWSLLSRSTGTNELSIG
ncbi:MFS transporter [Deinococcus sp. QL22]|uniref:MFS transporter n=1 Tax=Deinococcus sp. QL22 TaxID=2939437 RepID=UPI002017FB85|nr:MFS transporter [Deinococcus sp. QL22]UQN09425.1 MFS transporter [Deinococcus sp. QL22]